MKKLIVPQSFVALLYEDGVFKQILEPGRHKLRDKLFVHVVRKVRMVDMRERTLTIKGQEILTADKVAVRVSLLVYFRVRDPEAALHSVADYEERIYEDVQLAARRFLASRTLEAILGDRNEISDAVREVVSGQAEAYGVDVLRAEVKDLVFPGNLREIMNQVLETERRAEAKLIQARKEAEAQEVKTEADARDQRQRLAVEREQTLARAQAELEARRLRLQGEQQEAEAIAERPDLLRLRELSTLAEMARAGASFAVGLDARRLVTLLDDRD
jgi:regulator of protease activity HflC (stomatin/prohibitin superfamily)